MKKTTLMSIAYSVLGGLLFYIKYQQESGILSAANFALNWNVIAMVTLVIMAILLSSPVPDVQPPKDLFFRCYIPVLRIVCIYAGVFFAQLAIKVIDSHDYFIGIFAVLVSIGFLYCGPQIIHNPPLEAEGKNSKELKEHVAAQKAYWEIFERSNGTGFQDFLKGWMARANSANAKENAIAEAGRNLGVAQAKGDTAAIAYWSDKLDDLVVGGNQSNRRETHEKYSHT